MSTINQLKIGDILQQNSLEAELPIKFQMICNICHFDVLSNKWFQHYLMSLTHVDIKHTIIIVRHKVSRLGLAVRRLAGRQDLGLILFRLSSLFKS